MARKNNSMLLLIDCQYDFLEGGSLPVSGAKGIMDDLARYVEKYGSEYKIIVATLDQHPINHCSFKENGGEWPMHCVKFSHGASLYEPLAKAVINVVMQEPKTTTFSIYPKGEKADKEEYSAFNPDSDNAKALLYHIEKLGIEQIDVAGICGDVCVLNTLQSLIDMGFKDKLNVMEEFCPSLDDGSTLHKFISNI